MVFRLQADRWSFRLQADTEPGSERLYKISEEDPPNAERLFATGYFRTELYLMLCRLRHWLPSSRRGRHFHYGNRNLRQVNWYRAADQAAYRLQCRMLRCQRKGQVQ